MFLGVFYHLRHPLLALESIRKVCGGTLLIQTITTPHQFTGYAECPPPRDVDSGLRAEEFLSPDFPSLRFVEGCLDGDVSCWFVPSVGALLAMLRASGFRPALMACPNPHEVIVRAESC